MEGASVSVSLMIKQLASCDTKTRNTSLRLLLNTWLPSQSQISDDDMKKLWKGLFYCFWHADKLPAQTHLIHRLTSSFTQLHLPLSLHYLSVFFLTMRREWSGIDALRLDKFYLLIRRFMSSFFLVLKNNSWDLDLSTRFMSVLLDTTFMADDKFQSGCGVNYHVASLFLEELRAFLPVTKQVVEVLFGPFVSVMGRVPDKVLLAKIKTNLFDVLLKMGKKLLEVKKSGVAHDDDDFVVLGSIALALGFSSKFYELGSSLECCQGNRKVLFDLHEEFLKLEKDLASSGIDISIPEAPNNDALAEEDEVPTLVPIATGMEVDGSRIDVANGTFNKHLKMKKKKCKKAKKAKKSKNAISVPTIEDSGSDVNSITFNESALLNLQTQFEKVAAELGLDKHGVASACDFPKVTGNGTVSKKRKRAISMDAQQQPENPELAGQGDAEDSTTGKSREKSAKKVSFSMKNNLVWKPHSPLPPQSLRIPPSVTPRGSALKKGIPPGPVREMSPANRKVKQRAKSMKKGRKVINGISPATKRLKKLKSLST